MSDPESQAKGRATLACAIRHLAEELRGLDERIKKATAAVKSNRPAVARRYGVKAAGQLFDLANDIILNRAKLVERPVDKQPDLFTRNHER